jgi:hypothetical protein
MFAPASHGSKKRPRLHGQYSSCPAKINVGGCNFEVGCECARQNKERYEPIIALFTILNDPWNSSGFLQPVSPVLNSPLRSHSGRPRRRKSVARFRGLQKVVAVVAATIGQTYIFCLPPLPWLVEASAGFVPSLPIEKIVLGTKRLSTVVVMMETPTRTGSVAPGRTWKQLKPESSMSSPSHQTKPREVPRNGVNQIEQQRDHRESPINGSQTPNPPRQSTNMPFNTPPLRRRRQSPLSPWSSAARRRRKTKTQPMPVTGYSARAIEDYYNVRPFQVAWRLNTLGFPFLGKWT